MTIVSMLCFLTDRVYFWNAGLWRRHDHRGRYEAIPHICGAKAIPTSLLVFYRHLELNSQSIKPTVERLSYIFHDSSISRDPHLLTGIES